MLDKSGTIGGMFNGKYSSDRRDGSGLTLWDATADGAIGGTAQKIGGPLDKEGMIGKHFNADGAIGGTAQSLADKNQK